MLANILKNWKTTSVGAAAFVYAIGDVITQVTTQSWDISRLHTDAVAIMSGIGFILSKDHNTK
jgi:hypothetical protein